MVWHGASRPERVQYFPRMKHVHCPHCGSARVHRSRRRTVLEHVAGAIGTLARCHECGVRVLQAAGCAIRVDAMDRTWKRAVTVLLVAAAVGAILVVILLLGRLTSSGIQALLLNVP
jgi:hypothetical protein